MILLYFHYSNITNFPKANGWSVFIPCLCSIHFICFLFIPFTLTLTGSILHLPMLDSKNHKNDETIAQLTQPISPSVLGMKKTQIHLSRIYIFCRMFIFGWVMLVVSYTVNFRGLVPTHRNHLYLFRYLNFISILVSRWTRCARI